MNNNNQNDQRQGNNNNRRNPRRTVRKEYGGKEHTVKIVKYDASRKQYWITYDDNDSEELTYSEINEIKCDDLNKAEKPAVNLIPFLLTNLRIQFLQIVRRHKIQQSGPFSVASNLKILISIYRLHAKP